MKGAARWIPDARGAYEYLHGPIGYTVESSECNRTMMLSAELAQYDMYHIYLYLWIMLSDRLCNGVMFSSRFLSDN